MKIGTFKLHILDIVFLNYFQTDIEFLVFVDLLEKVNITLRYHIDSGLSFYWL